MLIKKSLYLFLLLIFIASCNNGTNNNNSSGKNKKLEKQIPEFYKDLDKIKKEGKLKALTIYSNSSYFLYRGMPMGFEYELLTRFAKYLNLDLEISIVRNIDSMFNKLNTGKADIIAYGITVTAERKKQVDFTDYLYLTHQVLVQKKPENWRKMKLHEIKRTLINDAIKLSGKTVSVRKNSSYYLRLKNLSKEIGEEINIDTIPGSFSTAEIIKKLVDGEIKYTVADNNIASINASYYPILDINTPVSFSQRISWATRFNSPELKEKANKWLSEFKKTSDYYVIYNKYFKNKRHFKKRIKSDYFSLKKQKISPYDDLIKKYAAKINWDWRLLSSLIYQESQFKPKAKSWAGAKGLMQIMPSTAKELGITNRSNPEQSLKGGTKYLNQIWNKFENISDSVQRIKFTMAAYNCGYYHVIDAQNLAQKRNLNIKLWDDNVEKMILSLSYPKNYNDKVVNYGYVKGIEPYNYVEQIFKRHSHYKKFISKK